ncbi:hypothetical protein ACFFKE_00705 [Streptomyces mutabilis]|uniref:hypothetical protein n=1 Tax=Streptomyces mutabilis TaxID=67332 RepID=UPI0017850D5E|nr:hypothetical protein [Streptomyces mutabilis]GGQ01422.1 hypothetical protein GCM10010279_05550 [Streptomyces mutabilis]
MKSLKAVAVVAGSLAAVGSAAPAFAQDAPGLTAGTLDGAVSTLTTDPVNVLPEKAPSELLDTENKESVLHTVKDVSTQLDSGDRLLGGLPLGG